jgi:hypothetical protein
MEIYNADKVYASCIFTKNTNKLNNLLCLREDIQAGGTGYDLNVKLPPEIEAMKPRINYGFTTRGCIRSCPFCFVPRAEGYIRAVGDIYDVWDRRSKSITLLDNNILALPDHFKMICEQLIREDLAVDFNQGLDIRLITPQVCEYLERLRIKTEIRFAFDSPELEPIIRDRLALLRHYKIRKRPFFYVLVGFNTTFEQDLHRLEVLRELHCRAYVMRHENTPRERRYVRLAQWANQFWTFAKYGFSEFIKAKESNPKGKGDRGANEGQGIPCYPLWEATGLIKFVPPEMPQKNGTQMLGEA